MLQQKAIFHSIFLHLRQMAVAQSVSFSNLQLVFFKYILNIFSLKN